MRSVWFGGLLLSLMFCGSLLADEEKPAKDDQMTLLKTFLSEFVEITPGKGKFPATLEMGSQTGSKAEQPRHRVVFTEPFAINKYEMPQNLYESIMGDNPSRWKGPRNSVEMMTWSEANRFCELITTKLRELKLIEKDEVIRLPSEAEWEYCCRAGTDTAYSFGDKATAPADENNQASLLDPYAWHTGNAAGNDPPVGALKPNPWGLYDMHGYLWEFTSDDWSPHYREAPSKPHPWMLKEKPKTHPVRGGSWRDSYDKLTSSYRVGFREDQKSDAIGFRCVKSKVTDKD